MRSIVTIALGDVARMERPAFARCASYGGFEVRRSAEREGGSGMRDPGFRRFAPPSGLQTAIRYSLLAFFSIAAAVFAAQPAAAVDCAPYCDYTHDYGPYDLSWKQPGRYAFPVCAPNGECAPHAVHVYSPVSGWPTYWPYRGVRITIRPRNRHR
jgi:hypothetical protein